MHSFDLIDHKIVEYPSMLQKVRFPIVCENVAMESIYVLFTTMPNNDAFKLDNKITLQQYNTYRRCKDWTFCPKLPEVITDTSGASIASHDAELFIAGLNGQFLSFNCHSWMWSVLKRSRDFHRFGSTFSMNGLIYVCGGKKGGKASDVIECYNTNTETWETLDIKLPCPMYFGFCFPLSNH